MDKNKLKYFIDAGLGISFFAVFITGIIKYPGLVHSLGADYRQIPMGGISRVHDLSGVTMGFFVLLHLTLNRKWIVSTTKELFGGGDKKCKK